MKLGIFYSVPTEVALVAYCNCLPEWFLLVSFCSYILNNLLSYCDCNRFEVFICFFETLVVTECFIWNDEQSCLILFRVGDVVSHSWGFCEARIMGDEYSGIRRWEDMDIDILVKIFQRMNIYELTSGVAHVCHTWRMAACDPLLWKTLDLTLLKSNFIKIPLEPYVYVDGRSDKTFTRVLKIALNLSRQSILTMIFHFNMYVSDDQLTYTAKR